MADTKGLKAIPMTAGRVKISGNVAIDLRRRLMGGGKFDEKSFGTNLMKSGVISVLLSP